ncbi:MAG TPA: PfkB family carbohydrate kinase [Flavisolibacter sp.]|nr:PfkB family carbohydrate kinase [Flavisolibacter sp.]
MQYDLCCIGHITIDKVVSPAGTVLMPGGTSFYFANAVAGLNVSFKLVTALAPEDIYAVEMLRERDIDIDVHPSSHTLFFENIYGVDTDHRVQRVLQKADAFTPEQLKAVNASIIHIGPLLADDFSGTIIKQVAKQKRISLDVQGLLRKVDNSNVVPVDWQEKIEVLPFIEFFKANEEELAVVTGQSNIEAGAKLVQQWGAKEVIITLGSKGSMIFSGKEVYRIPAFAPEQITDATGCGDTYMAGYLFKRCKGFSIQDAGEFAAAMATLKLQQSGPFTGTEADVEALLAIAS